MNKIYLDHSATTPVLPPVAEDMARVLTENYGNPSSVYATGQAAKHSLIEARETVASLLGAATADEIVFTSGGTESDNLAIKGVIDARKQPGGHIITTTIEHPAVYEPIKQLEKSGYSVTYVPVGKNGIVEPQAVARAVTTSTILVSIMLVTNVVGTLQPVAEI